MRAPEIIDDLSCDFPLTPPGTTWDCVTDGVMGGLSQGRMTRETVNGRAAIRMTGDVSLANNGGFVQIALDLAPGAGVVDASGWSGIAITICGPPETYNLHLRTAEITRPWQSYRQTFRTTPDWTTFHLPFSGFTPHRTDAAFDPRRLRRIGIVAIGRAFRADLALSDVRFFD